MKRTDAIKLLEETVMIDEECCRVDGGSVSITDKNLLLEQLKNKEAYLKVPMLLWFSLVKWKELKLDSNVHCGILLGRNERTDGYGEEYYSKALDIYEKLCLE